MTPDLLILRPEPGASATAARAKTMGLTEAIAPIFTIAPIAWQPPEGAFEAVLLTSANAARHAGEALQRFTHLPCFAVGEATGAAAADAGFAQVRTGPSDLRALLALLAAEGVGRTLHPCGREHLDSGSASILSIPVYAADPVEALPPAARDALAAGAVALLHSPRGGETFGRLIDDAGLARDRISIAAISEAAEAAAGKGWRRSGAAARPRDDALLELAAKLCQNGGAATRAGG